MEGSPDGRLSAAGGAAAAPGEPGPNGRLGQLLAVLLAGIAAGASAVAFDVYLRDGGHRMLAAGILLGVLGLSLALAAAIWSREPQPWRHRFVSQRYHDALYPRIAAVLSAEMPPRVPVITPERVLSATWVREALAERIVMGRNLGPSEVATALDRPLESEALADRPALRRFLHETRDLGVAPAGTVLTLPRKEFLKAAEAALSEAGSL